MDGGNRAMNIIDRLGNKQIEKVLGQRQLPEFAPGDTHVDVKVIEGTRERIQAFEGVVRKRTALTHHSCSENFLRRGCRACISMLRKYRCNSYASWTGSSCEAILSAWSTGKGRVSLKNNLSRGVIFLNCPTGFVRFSPAAIRE